MATTNRDIAVQLEGINTILESINAKYRIKYEQCYGYSKLEKVDSVTQNPLFHPMVAGTKKRVPPIRMCAIARHVDGT